VLGLVYAVKEGAANGLRVDIAVIGVGGVAAFTLFVRRQLRLPAPLIDVRLFCNRAFSGVVAANLLSVLGLSGLVFFLSQFFQLVQGYSPMKAGLAELPARSRRPCSAFWPASPCATGRSAPSSRPGWH